ncbi:Peptidase S33 tripeptidyl aminopeptidase-lik [Akanthomyces lecanii RCEF 1005]|uniref:Peptidase S33 tripeptidyl aminopeptidase-lik n=1 Tax=Akanthomyces lecanii RCEF 1005 TaxID=1081108 RepID=A0A167V9P6_CORDF|nr:Peptidase S33 tripeptidyl aminopeptidase-lik [Akanthomyces lecanii RCEF 1005]
MADSPESPIVVRGTSPTASPRRTTRQAKPSGRVQDTLRTLENGTEKPTAKPAARAARGASVETEVDAVGDVRKALRSGVKDLQGKQRSTQEEVRQARLELKTIKTATSSWQSSPQTSYAEIARMEPPNRPPSPPSRAPTRTTPSDMPRCTVDTSRVEEERQHMAGVSSIRQAIEAELRSKNGHEKWTCAAVVKDARDPHRIKVICRDENELQLVKEAAEKVIPLGTRVMRDQLYPVKVDFANRMAVLDSEGNVLPDALEALGAENNVSIAKITWLSNKDSGKAYGSMAVDVTGKDESWWMDYFQEQEKQSRVLGRYWPYTRLICSSWPVKANWRFTGPFTSPPADPSNKLGVPLAPILFLSNQLDPVTPLSSARRMSAGHPGSAIVVQNGIGHCALDSAPSDCTHALATEYMDTGEMPEGEVTCEVNCGPWDKDCSAH